MPQRNGSAPRGVSEALRRASVPAPPLPTENGKARRRGRSRLAYSSGLLFVVIEQLPNFGEFIPRGLARRERSHQHAACRSAEGALQQIARDLTLRPLAWLSGLVNVGALLLVTLDQVLAGHDLQLFQNRGVLRRAAAVDFFVDFADRAGSVG